MDDRIPVTRLTVTPWSGSSIVGKMKSGLSIFVEYLRLRQRIRSLDALISLGGYPAFPLLLGARELSVPIFIQEQNRIMGRTNRFFKNYALDVFYGLPPLDGNFPSSNVLGNPVRPPESPKDNWFHREPILVVLGGSQGARELSEVLSKTAEHLLERGWAIYYLKGQFGLDLDERDWASLESFRQVGFNPNLQSVLPAADVVWCRAGASTLSELIQYQLPAVLFPYEYASDRHQLHNARWMTRQGPSVIHGESNDESAGELLTITERLNRTTGNYSVPWETTEYAQERIAEAVMRQVK